MEAIHGCNKTIQINRISACKTCNGLKYRPGTSATNCNTCAGSGKIYYKQGFMTINLDCMACNGEGTQIKHPCTSCSGKGQSNNLEKETIVIPKAIDEKISLRLSKKVKIFYN